MNAKEILKEAFDSDIETLKMAYEADNKVLQTMLILSFKILIKLNEKQILSEEDIKDIAQENEINKICEEKFGVESFWKDIKVSKINEED